MEPFGYIASFLMGITLGVLGGGGAILTVPIMVYLFSFSPIVATGYSLFVVGLTALVGSLMYIRKGYINFKIGFSFAIPSMIGVNIARGLIIPAIPDIIFSVNDFTVTKEILIMVTFAILIITASFSMLKKRGEPKSVTSISTLQTSILAIGGLTVGLIAGFVGAGGGFLIIPALIFFARQPMRVAVGTSLMIIAIQSLFGFSGDVYRGLDVHWSFLISVAVIAIAGILLGTRVANKFNEQKLIKIFGWFVLLLGTIILIEQLSAPIN